MFVKLEGTQTEPLGMRVIESPESFERTEIRDTHGQSEGHFGEQIEKCAAGRRLTNPFL